MNFDKQPEDEKQENHLEKSTNSNSHERMKEISEYVQNYFNKYIDNENSKVAWVQGTRNNSWRNLDIDSHKEIKDILKVKLKNKNLIDLGCGRDAENFPTNKDFELSLKKFNAVDIDPPPSDSGLEYITTEMKKNGITENISVIKKDILLYTADLPDESSNFILNNLDDDVIVEKQYWEYLASEITRATEKGGIVVSGGTARDGGIEKYLAKTKFKSIYKDTFLGEIFEKIA